MRKLYGVWKENNDYEGETWFVGFDVSFEQKERLEGLFQKFLKRFPDFEGVYELYFREYGDGAMEALCDLDVAGYMKLFRYVKDGYKNVENAFCEALDEDFTDEDVDDVFGKMAHFR